MPRCCFWFASVLLLLLPFRATADLPQQEAKPNLVVSRFVIARGGKHIGIPLTIQGKSRLFFVDTGSSRTVIDLSLLSTKETRTSTVLTSSGILSIKQFQAPAITVGGKEHDFSADIYGMDMQRMREVSGIPFYGILGMDFLKHKIVSLNFDTGELCILKAVPTDAGVKHTLHPNLDNPELKEVKVEVKSLGEVRFTIDTGSDGIMLQKSHFDILILNKKMNVVGQTLAENAKDTRVSRLGRGAVLTMGKICQNECLLGEADVNCLGLAFLARYEVTFDFPQQTMYLRPGKALRIPEFWDLSGLHVLKKGDTILIDVVDKNSPAELAGIRPGDHLCKVNGMAPSQSLFEIRQQLKTPGNVTLAVERDGTEITVVLRLQH